MARVDRTTLLRPTPHSTLTLLQPERGYRFNADSLQLVQFAAGTAPVEALCDLGAGCGVIGLSLLAMGAARRGAFVELDPEQARRCEHNLEQNRLEGTVFVGNVEQRELPTRYELVVCNPPYFAPDEGRHSPEPARDLARFGRIEDFVQAAARACSPTGRVCFVYLARSAVRLFDALRSSGLEPKRLRWVHARPDSPARLVLVEARRGNPGGLVVESPAIELL